MISTQSPEPLASWGEAGSNAIQYALQQGANTMTKPDRDLEKTYTTSQFVAKLRRLADCLEQDEPFEIMDHPDGGRIGAVPYFRTGGHRPGGFAMLKGPSIEPGTSLPCCNVYDLAPTILGLLGIPVPGHFEGTSILDRGATLARIS